MNKVTLISYANNTFSRAQKLNSWTGKYIGKVDRIVEKNASDIDASFLSDNSKILSQKRGAGLWLWKPYIILQELNSVDFGDYVFYCDSGACFCRSIDPLIDSMGDQDIWVSELPLIEYEWTKPSVFAHLGIHDPIITNTSQIQASFIIVRKSEWSCNFIAEWLALCMQADLIMPIQTGEDSGRCIAHREDQSLLSVLCKMRGVKPHRDPTQYARLPETYSRFTSNICVHDYPQDRYKNCIILHRNGNAAGKVVLFNTLLAFLPIRFAKWLHKKLVLRK